MRFSIIIKIFAILIFFLQTQTICSDEIVVVAGSEGGTNVVQDTSKDEEQDNNVVTEQGVTQDATNNNNQDKKSQQSQEAPSQQDVPNNVQVSTAKEYEEFSNSLQMSIGYINTSFFKGKTHVISSLGIVSTFRTKGKRFFYFATAGLTFPINSSINHERLSVFGQNYPIFYFLETGASFLLYSNKRYVHLLDLGIGINEASIFDTATMQLGLSLTYNMIYRINKVFAVTFIPSFYYGIIDLFDVKYKHYRYGIKFTVNIGFLVYFRSLFKDDEE